MELLENFKNEEGENSMAERKIKKLLAMVLAVCLAGSTISAGALEGRTEPVAQIEGKEVQYSTLQEAVDAAASGDTIKLLRDTNESNIWIKPSETAEPRKLTIDLGGFAIDPQGKGTGLYVDAPDDNLPATSLTVKNGTLRNCAPEASSSTPSPSPTPGDGKPKRAEGGAICCFGDLTLENCTIENNSYQVGGGVFVGNMQNNTTEYKGGKAIIRSCIFQGNSTTAAMNGGAVVLNGNVDGSRIENTTFNNNTSGLMGGAVCLGMGTVVVKDCIFNGNTASHGGALAGAGTTLVVENTTFTGNTASSMGGAVHIQQEISIPDFTGSLSVQGGSMIENKAAYGGAISVAGSSFSVANTKITENEATTHGGAVYAQGNATLEINTALSGNTAGSDGGAVYANKANVTITGDLTGNSAGRDGGAVCAYQYSLHINGNLTGNKAAQNGGAIFSKWSNIGVNGGVNGNSAAFGGGIYSDENTHGEQYDGIADLTKASIYNNIASAAGDDIYLGSGNSASISSVKDDWMLAGCGDPIDGWYQDDEGARWNGHGDPAVAEEISLEFRDEMASVSGIIALKAAHSAVEEIPEESTPSGAPESGNSEPGSSSSNSTEEIPEEDTPLAPPTGENSHTSVAAILVILSGAALTILLAMKRSKKAAE